ncbi:acyl-CoA dehydrogenase C-terminal domain-containing protein [Pseudonocardia nigra]|uniref:acyl-CoA dehydrogenase C-terminal domain-containing protein n=1 Tax=Pseudonocardia nigra TaxID=1921578 RepID=UPI0027E34758|nr:acyl-CoA dehydrogenase [Pseudonocardia nigra]
MEQHYRDNRLNPIHEGTHGIQGLDLLGRKVVMSGGAGLRLLTATIERATAKAHAAGGEAAELAAQLQTALDRLVAVTVRIHGAVDAHSAADDRARLANASIYLEAAGHVVLAWIWLEQYLACAGRDEPFHQGKRQATRFFFRYELPRTGPQLDLLDALDRTTVETDPAWL